MFIFETELDWMYLLFHYSQTEVAGSAYGYNRKYKKYNHTLVECILSNKVYLFFPQRLLILYLVFRMVQERSGTVEIRVERVFGKV